MTPSMLPVAAVCANDAGLRMLSRAAAQKNVRSCCIVKTSLEDLEKV
jgi:hypothetical protein